MLLDHLSQAIVQLEIEVQDVRPLERTFQEEQMSHLLRT